MVVLTIIGLCGSLVTIRFSSTIRRCRVDAAVQQWLSADHFVRTISTLREGTLVIDSSDSAVELQLISFTGEVQRRWAFPSTIHLDLSGNDGDAVTAILYRASSGSNDYQVIVKDGAVQAKIRIAGATGHAITQTL